MTKHSKPKNCSSGHKDDIEGEESFDVNRSLC